MLWCNITKRVGNNKDVPSHPRSLILDSIEVPFKQVIIPSDKGKIWGSYSENSSAMGKCVPEVWEARFKWGFFDEMSEPRDFSEILEN